MLFLKNGGCVVATTLYICSAAIVLSQMTEGQMLYDDDDYSQEETFAEENDDDPLPSTDEGDADRKREDNKDDFYIQESPETGLDLSNSSSSTGGKYVPTNASITNASEKNNVAESVGISNSKSGIKEAELFLDKRFERASGAIRIKHIGTRTEHTQKNDEIKYGPSVTRENYSSGTAAGYDQGYAEYDSGADGYHEDNPGPIKLPDTSGKYSVQTESLEDGTRPPFPELRVIKQSNREDKRNDHIGDDYRERSLINGDSENGRYSASNSDDFKNSDNYKQLLSAAEVRQHHNYDNTDSKPAYEVNSNKHPRTYIAETKTIRPNGILSAQYSVTPEYKNGEDSESDTNFYNSKGSEQDADAYDSSSSISEHQGHESKPQGIEKYDSSLRPEYQGREIKAQGYKGYDGSIVRPNNFYNSRHLSPETYTNNMSKTIQTFRDNEDHNSQDVSSFTRNNPVPSLDNSRENIATNRYKADGAENIDKHNLEREKTPNTQTKYYRGYIATNPMTEQYYFQNPEKHTTHEAKDKSNAGYQSETAGTTEEYRNMSTGSGEHYKQKNIGADKFTYSGTNAPSDIYNANIYGTSERSNYETSTKYPNIEYHKFMEGHESEQRDDQHKQNLKNGREYFAYNSTNPSSKDTFVTNPRSSGTHAHSYSVDKEYDSRYTGGPLPEGAYYNIDGTHRSHITKAPSLTLPSQQVKYGDEIRPVHGHRSNGTHFANYKGYDEDSRLEKGNSYSKHLPTEETDKIRNTNGNYEYKDLYEQAERSSSEKEIEVPAYTPTRTDKGAQSSSNEKHRKYENSYEFISEKEPSTFYDSDVGVESETSGPRKEYDRFTNKNYDRKPHVPISQHEMEIQISSSTPKYKGEIDDRHILKYYGNIKQIRGYDLNKESVTEPYGPDISNQNKFRGSTTEKYDLKGFPVESYTRVNHRSRARDSYTPPMHRASKAYMGNKAGLTNEEYYYEPSSESDESHILRATTEKAIQQYKVRSHVQNKDVSKDNNSPAQADYRLTNLKYGKNSNIDANTHNHKTTGMDDFDYPVSHGIFSKESFSPYKSSINHQRIREQYYTVRDLKREEPKLFINNHQEHYEPKVKLIANVPASSYELEPTNLKQSEISSGEATIYRESFTPTSSDTTEEHNRPDYEQNYQVGARLSTPTSFYNFQSQEPRKAYNIKENVSRSYEQKSVPNSDGHLNDQKKTSSQPQKYLHHNKNYASFDEIASQPFHRDDRVYDFSSESLNPITDQKLLYMPYYGNKPTISNPSGEGVKTPSSHNHQYFNQPDVTGYNENTGYETQGVKPTAAAYESVPYSTEKPFLFLHGYIEAHANITRNKNKAYKPLIIFQNTRYPDVYDSDLAVYNDSSTYSEINQNSTKPIAISGYEGAKNGCYSVYPDATNRRCRQNGHQGMHNRNIQEPVKGSTRSFLAPTLRSIEIIRKLTGGHAHIRIASSRVPTQQSTNKRTFDSVLTMATPTGYTDGRATMYSEPVTSRSRGRIRYNKRGSISHDKAMHA